jgi:hypothetical protein
MGGEGSGNFGHAGRPGEVGGSAQGEGSEGFAGRAGTLDKERFKTVKGCVDDFTKKDYHKADYEHLIAYKNGEYSHESKTKDRSSCQIADVIDMDLVHNHPGGCPALSAPDVFVSAYQNALSITATNAKGEAWTVSRPREGWATWATREFGAPPDTSEFQRRVQEQFNNTADEVFSLPEMQPLHLAFTRGEIDLSEAEYVFSKKTSEQFCKKYNITLTKHWRVQK